MMNFEKPYFEDEADRLVGTSLTRFLPWVFHKVHKMDA
jgi:hypothetical protein